jgi:hypothetical protein
MMFMLELKRAIRCYAVDLPLSSSISVMPAVSLSYPLFTNRTNWFRRPIPFDQAGCSDANTTRYYFRPEEVGAPFTTGKMDAIFTLMNSTRQGENC